MVVCGNCELRCVHRCLEVLPQTRSHEMFAGCFDPLLPALLKHTEPHHKE